MKKINFNIITLIITTFVLIISIYNIYPKKKLAWIDLPAVYKDFTYKKELETRFQKTREARKNIMDSLELELKILSNEIQLIRKSNTDKIIAFKLKRENYLNKKKIFEEDDFMNKEKYEEQIMTQLTQYVKDYGQENGYAFIYGADGTGSLMYANEADNITDDIKTYVNNKYEGIN